MERDELSARLNRLFSSHQDAQPATTHPADIPTTPEHIVGARADATYSFLREVFLPRVAQEPTRPLTVIELVKLATQFKEGFKARHPEDYDGSYELIPDTEYLLLGLRVSTKVFVEHTKGEEQSRWNEIGGVLKNASEQLERIMDADADFELMQI